MFQTKIGKEVLTEMIPNTVCPRCKSEGSLQVTAFTKHLAFGNLPIITEGRRAYITCLSCEARIPAKEASFNSQIYANEIKGKVSIPIWQFSGLVLFFLIGILCIFLLIKAEESLDTRYLNDPLVADIYEYRSRPGFYSLFRIERVGLDSVSIRLSAYEVDGITGLEQLHSPDKYEDYITTISKDSIQQMFNEDIIVDIERPLLPNLGW